MALDDDRPDAGPSDDVRARRRRLALILALVAAVIVLAGVVAAVALSQGGA
jgi:hypothetical protein